MSKPLVQVLKDFCGVKYSGAAVKSVFKSDEHGMFERRLAQLHADNLTLDLLKGHDSGVTRTPTPTTGPVEHKCSIVKDTMVINQFIRQ